jgi:hypothetical protein
MNEVQRNQWIDEVIQLVLAAIAHAHELRDVLIFKGAWILNAHLKDIRHSADIDANAATDWAAATPDLESQREFLEKTVHRVVNRCFERQSPVRFKVTTTKVEKHPPKGHPRSWTAFLIRLAIQDARNAGVSGLPPMEIDVAAPELLGTNAVQMIELLGAPAKVYALHRIGGEKLRAYLTSLPEYRKKMGGGERTPRVKDLFDLARIIRVKPIGDQAFWTEAVSEFVLACQSRLVECTGIETIMQEWKTAQSLYEKDPLLRAIPFHEAEASLKQICKFLTVYKFLPIVLSSGSV